jgi:Cysteine-rich secretory protein family
MRCAAVLALAGCLVAAAPAAAQDRPECPGADRPSVDAILCIVNVERTVRGLPPVARDARLDAAALGHSEDMVRRSYFDHVSPEGEGPDGRASRAGYPFRSLYENIALGQVTAREAMTGWMRSPGHCPGVLAPDVADMGVGMGGPGRYGRTWTQMFGLQQDREPPSADTAPADGCPYARLSIAPGPARVSILGLGRTGRRVTVFGRLQDEGAGRRIVVVARRGGRAARRRTVTLANGFFRVTLRAPRGRGRVAVTATAPAVPDVYETGRDTRRI